MPEKIVRYKTGESHEIVEEVGKLIRCKDCIKKPLCIIYRETNDDYGYCSLAERKRNDTK